METDKSDFEIIGQSPHLWLSSAKHLKKAADIICDELVKTLASYSSSSTRIPYDEIVLFKSYMLLAGLSLENLAKGILIGRNPNIVNSNELDRKLLGKSKGGHDLVATLMQKISLELLPSEIDVVSRLTKFVVWAGKYPIHFKADQNTQPSFTTNDPAIINSLFEKLATILKEENSI